MTPPRRTVGPDPLATNHFTPIDGQLCHTTNCLELARHIYLGVPLCDTHHALMVPKLHD